PYETLSVMMLPGDTLVLMTDGITESHDATGTQFGSANVLRVIDSLPDPSSAQEIMMSIVQRVRDFAEGTEQFDDIGILVVRYNGPSS
ncbi:MAG: PP2C family protein-serine/threonine phosphatase, partial [Candidatus Kapaibacterium sp.]